MNQKLIITACALAGVLIFGLVFGDRLLDKLSDRVMKKIEKKYSPSPYGPGLDPDIVDESKIKKDKEESLDEEVPEDEKTEDTVPPAEEE